MKTKSKLLRAILSLTVAGIVYVFMFYFTWLVLGWFIPFEFIMFLIPPIASGFTVSKTYSNGLLVLALVGFFSPFFIHSLVVMSQTGSPINVIYTFTDATSMILTPTISMFSALFFRKDFRSKIGL